MSSGQLLTVTGARVRAYRLKKGADILRPAIERGLLDAMENNIAHMKSSFLSGRVLKVQTGKLRGGWTVIRRLATDQEVAVAGVTNTVYAAAQNYGFHGAVVVREHDRRIKVRRKRESKPKANKRGLRQVTEKKNKLESKARRRDSSHAAHGMGVAAKQKQSRDYRRSMGTQEKSGGRSKASNGLVHIGRHGRFMKLRATHYVERSMRETKLDTVKLIRRRVRMALALGGK